MPRVAFATRGLGCMTMGEVTGTANRPGQPGTHDEPVKPKTPEEKAFVHGLVERGEAAYPDKEGKLPAGATHEIVGEGPDGLPIVRRRRFSAS